MSRKSKEELLEQLNELQVQMSSGQVSKSDAAKQLATLVNAFKALNLTNSLTDADYFVITDFLVADLNKTSSIEVEQYGGLLSHAIRAFTQYE
ncbi:MAG TPA: hypothetical protein VFH06_00780 [Candidatus Saccharimonadales bacterium]|nr:hypothetical protein [Candidatus Saccharimonadales bacterium]